jgi:nucleotide-binding universal stress UspA family protein
MTSNRPILHPTDFSADSALAFRLACLLARDVGGRLIVLHVQSGTGAHKEGPNVVEEVLWKQLHALRPEHLTVPVEHHLHPGDTVDQILRMAKDKDCGLIVMGTAGRSGLRRVFTASVADRIRRKAHCPVVTVQGAYRMGHGDSTQGRPDRAVAVAGAAQT